MPAMADGPSSLFDTLARVPDIEVADAAALDTLLRQAETPFIVRGLVSDWPLVQAGLRSGRAARDYLLGLQRDTKFVVSVGDPTSQGRLFYNHQMGMNFQTVKAGLPEIFTRIDAIERRPDAPPIYLASINMQEFFDGLHEANHVDLGDRAASASIWMGTRTRIAAHNDFPDNLACVAVGRRRFTLFPREQFRNLYLGPVDNTPAGRAISMVDFHAPDFQRFPRFRQALEHAQVAELNAGDAVFIPSMWWHHVEGLSDFNILVNYWWRDTPRWLGQPQDALNLAMLTIRDLPEDERRHWRDMFDYYIFTNGPEVMDHIPPEGRSVLAPLTPENAARIRGFLLRQLNQ